LSWAVAAVVAASRLAVQAAAARHAGQQEVHLVGQDAAPAQDHVLVQAGHVGQVQQAHARFFGQPVALAAVAGAAGGDAVHPAVAAAARHRHDVLARQLVEVEAAAAVGADMAVAHEQLGVGQRRRLPPGARRDGAAHRDDGVHLDARLQPGGALDAAAQHLEGLAQRPGDGVAGVEHRPLRGRDPRLRPTRHRAAARPCLACLPGRLNPAGELDRDRIEARITQFHKERLP
jgi:hypothetical protein